MPYNSLRIFIIINHLKTGGAEKQSIYLTKALSRHYETRLIVYNAKHCDNRMLSLLSGVNEKVVWLKGNHLSKLVAIYRIFRCDKKSAVISFLARGNLINGVIGSLAGTKMRIGGIRSSRHNSIKLLIQKALHNYLLTCTVFNNHAGYNLLTSTGFNPGKSVVIHNGIDIQKSPINRRDKHNILILSVGRFVKAKDYKTALNTIALLNNKMTPPMSMKYIIIGHGELEGEIRKYSRKLNIENYIELIVNPNSVSLYYEQADIFLSTSLFEGLSNAIMEAMEHSLPVIATRVGDNNELVKDEITGFLTPIRDAETIAHKLFMLIDNYNLRIEMGRQGYLHLKENFSLKTFSSKNLALIGKLLG